MGGRSASSLGVCCASWPHTRGKKDRRPLYRQYSIRNWESQAQASVSRLLFYAVIPLFGVPAVCVLVNADYPPGLAPRSLYPRFT